MGLPSGWILVTGGARRLGRAVATALAGRGGHLALHYHRSAAEARQLSRDLAPTGGEIRLIGADLANHDDLQKLISEVRENCRPLRGLINSAAVYHRTPLDGLERQQWEETLAVNLWAPVWLSVMLGRIIQADGGGSIIEVGDWSAHRPYPGYLAYTVSKGALETATLALARELAPDVRVNMVALGPLLLPDDSDPAYEERVRTAVPLGRLGGAVALEEAVRYLLGDASYCTGTVLTVDGGRHLR